jgi:hypothetical protein
MNYIYDQPSVSCDLYEESHFCYHILLICFLLESNIWIHRKALLYIILITKISTSWDTTLHSPLRINSRFRGTYCLYLQGWKVSQARDQYEAGSKQGFVSQLTLNEVHSIISQKITTDEILKSCNFSNGVHVKALCCKLEGHGFKSRWGGFFKLT